ncbi:alginate O-acetyltransferase AlgF [Marinobacter arenosus]|uniref:alginate O-acetyltransferase AlgF n=1 Tax=Marinobacter arenosus TaxID=2856822 RepID=UPI001C4D83DF|nr:alginate O-acetyltransferase AlgF [Marinobacter arenosus]MBW0148538.1 alginate O-acetyltransferase AlgF [Marinobacter arenosus]
MQLTIKAVFAVLLSLLMPLAAQAGEDALYAAEAPDGAAFIRVVNADVSGSIPLAEIGGKAIKDIAPMDASPYIYLPGGTYELSVGQQAAPITMEKNRFYTAVVLDSGELEILPDKTFKNPRKALVSFYNLTGDGGISLKTADGKVAVIDPLDPISVGNREINAVKISLGAFSGGEAVAQTPPVNLQRGKVFSFFVIDAGGSPRLLVAENRVDTSV